MFPIERKGLINNLKKKKRKIITRLEGIDSNREGLTSLKRPFVIVLKGATTCMSLCECIIYHSILVGFNYPLSNMQIFLVDYNALSLSK